MSNIEINKNLVRKITADLDKLIADYMKGAGLNVGLSKASYSTTEMTVKYTFSAPGESRLEVAYNMFKEAGWPEIGETIMLTNGDKFVIRGYDVKKRAYPIIVEKEGTGESYKMPISILNKAKIVRS